MSVSTSGVSLRERQRQEREQLIVSAAEELFLEQGYHDTSIDDIAARVGIAKGTVYLHFASKEELMVALHERGMRSFIGMLDTTLASDATPRHKLEVVIEHMFGSLSSRHYQLFTSVFRNPEFAEFAARLREKKSLLDDLWKEPTRRLIELLDAGKAAGEFDDSIPTPVMLALFWSLVAPHGFQRLIEREQMAPAAIARHVTNFFFKGIAAPHQTTLGGDHQ